MSAPAIKLSDLKSPADLKQQSPQALADLAGEIRAFLIEKVSKSGGHLGPNLGVVELTIAIHKTFDSPKDVIVFDTGHQSYVHKLLTGRADGFDRLRQRGGIAGYPNRKRVIMMWWKIHMHRPRFLGVMELQKDLN